MCKIAECRERKKEKNEGVLRLKSERSAKLPEQVNPEVEVVKEKTVIVIGEVTEIGNGTEIVTVIGIEIVTGGVGAVEAENAGEGLFQLEECASYQLTDLGGKRVKYYDFYTCGGFL